jgi:hypothetical protein
LLSNHTKAPEYEWTVFDERVTIELDAGYAFGISGMGIVPREGERYANENGSRSTPRPVETECTCSFLREIMLERKSM